MSGEAVFVYDGSDAAGHAGETDYGAGAVADGDKMFDFVQELLNQVVPRKRSVTSYTLVDENGVYGDSTRDAVAMFRSSFSLDNKALNDGRNSFRRLQREYGLSDGDAGMIIDRETLVGVEQRATDDLVNGTGGSSGDTGLYELYDNVVRKFIDAMIARAVAYRDAMFFANSSGEWKPRTYPGDDEQIQGVSYCYGCNDKVEDFVMKVTDCRVDSPVPSNYRGRITDDNAGCQVGTGSYRYTGLRQGERNIWHTYAAQQAAAGNCNVVRNHKFYPVYWTGIDCSGFVQRVINAADPDITPGNGVPAVDVRVPDLDDYQLICANGQISLPNRTWAEYYFGHFADRRVTHYEVYPSNQSDRLKRLKLLRKGDLLKYVNDSGTTTHISIVYSERYGESDHNGDYDVIHAFSWECSANTQQCQTYPWLRKVGVTANNHPGLGAPRGFGRIRLWQ